MSKTYDDSRYGVTQRFQSSPAIKADINTVGTVAESLICVPFKAKLKKFGIISAGSDVVCSSTTAFELRTVNGTKVATFVTGSMVLGTGAATGVAPETATTLRQNVAYRCYVSTDPGDSGSVYFFADVTPEVDGF